MLFKQFISFKNIMKCCLHQHQKQFFNVQQKYFGESLGAGGCISVT
jgi:hypothetical protein